MSKRTVFQNKSCVLFFPTEEVFPESNPGKHSPSHGERDSDVFKTELALFLKKDKPVKTILTQVASYKAMVDFLRVIIII